MQRELRPVEDHGAAGAAAAAHVEQHLQRVQRHVVVVGGLADLSGDDDRVGGDEAAPQVLGGGARGEREQDGAAEWELAHVSCRR